MASSRTLDISILLQKMFRAGIGTRRISARLPWVGCGRQAGRPTAERAMAVTVGAPHHLNIRSSESEYRGDAKLSSCGFNPRTALPRRKVGGGGTSARTAVVPTHREADKTRGRSATWILENKHPDVLTRFDRARSMNTKLSAVHPRRSPYWKRWMRYRKFALAAERLRRSALT